MKYIWAFVKSLFLAALALALLAFPVSRLPVDGRGLPVVSAWYIAAVFALPAFIFLVSMGLSLRRPIRQHSREEDRLAAMSTPPDIPALYADRVAAAMQLSENFESHISAAYSSRTVDDYFSASDLATDDLRNLKRFVSFVPDEITDCIPYREASMSENFQWKLRDCIDLEKFTILVKIKGYYRNNKTALCESFADSLTRHASAYDPETTQLCISALRELSEKSGLPLFFKGSPVLLSPDDDPQ